jgi:hypothetical protein
LASKLPRTKLVRWSPYWTSLAYTRLVWYTIVLFPKFINSYNSCYLLTILWCLMSSLILSISGMDPRREKRAKQGQDVVRSSKRGRSSKAVVTRHPPPPHHHPSHSNDEEEDDCELLKRHAPVERSNHLAIKYSKKTKQSTINANHKAPVYARNKQSMDRLFWSLFHYDWYHSIYLYKKKPVVETKWVNWDWMASRRHTIFNQIKTTCDKLEMTKMMSFKYD